MSLRKLLIITTIGLLSLEICGCVTSSGPKRSAVQSPSREILKIANKRANPPLISPKAYAHYSMGLIYDNEGKTEDAISEYSKAAGLDPLAAQVYYRRGADYVKLGHLDKGVIDIKKTIELDKENARARFLLAIIYTSQKKYDEATRQ